MEDDLNHIHTVKDQFLLRQVGNHAKANVNSLRMELVKKRMVDMETNAEYWRASKMRCEVITCQDYISHNLIVFEKIDADLYLPGIHVLLHWVKLICQYCALHQYSAERHQQQYEMNLNISNDPNLG